MTSRDHVIRGSSDITGEFLLHKLPPWQVWWIWVLQKRRYFVSILSRNLMWPRGHRLMWNYGWVLFIISHHPHPKLLATAAVQEKIFHFYFVTWPHVIKGLESQVTLKVILPCHKWLPCKASWSQAFWKRRYKAFNLARELTWPRGSNDIMGEFCSL